MKLDLIKQTDADGFVTYYINKDEIFVTGSTCCGKDAFKKVMDIFETLKKGVLPKKEVILTEEI